MTYSQSAGSGRVQAAEGDLIVTPKNYARAKRGIVYCHGREPAGSSGAAEWQKYQRAKIISRLAAAGHIVLCCDLGGLGTWGNSTAVTRVGTAVTYLLGLNVLPTKVAILGLSMGAFTGLNWVAQNLSSCSCFVGVIPGLDLTDTHTNNRGSWASDINTAYGGAYSEASFGATYNPQTRAAAGAFGTLPIQLWYGLSDATFPPAQAAAFASSVGESVKTHGIVGAHDEATIDLVDIDSVINFIGLAG